MGEFEVGARPRQPRALPQVRRPPPGAGRPQLGPVLVTAAHQRSVTRPIPTRSRPDTRTLGWAGPARHLERVDGYAASKAEYALVIADEVPDQAGHRADLDRYRVSGTGGYRSRRLTRIVDTLHFAPSHVSRLVQAADLVTYLFQRLELPGTDPRTARVNEQLWSLVEPRRYHSWCWDPMRRQS
ncbi:DUF3800 domain-containing protein [Micromonospora wenchangensis]|uniref:DUF3800 domain-containing protein n=1 Tax=Micromonospora wenchangensis TaxID=1185415 RepID=UPI003D719FED